MSDQGYPNWQTELSEYVERLADDPREQHEREDFEHRHYDFRGPQVCSSGVMTANWPSAERGKIRTPKEPMGLCPSQVEARSPEKAAEDPANRAPSENFATGADPSSSRCDAGGPAPPAARDLTVRSHEAKRTESPPFAAGLNGGVGTTHAGPVDLQPWERYAWTPEAA